jgi:hypothetical protein
MLPGLTIAQTRGRCHCALYGHFFRAPLVSRLARKSARPGRRQTGRPFAIQFTSQRVNCRATPSIRNTTNAQSQRDAGPLSVPRTSRLRSPPITAHASASSTKRPNTIRAVKPTPCSTRSPAPPNHAFDDPRPASNEAFDDPYAHALLLRGVLPTTRGSFVAPGRQLVPLRRASERPGSRAAPSRPARRPTRSARRSSNGARASSPGSTGSGRALDRPPVICRRAPRARPARSCSRTAS